MDCSCYKFYRLSFIAISFTVPTTNITRPAVLQPLTSYCNTVREGKADAKARSAPARRRPVLSLGPGG